MRRRWLFLALLLWSAFAWGAPLRVHFFDVGQGDAALIVSPTGKTVLVDGGPPEATAQLAERVRELTHGAPIDLILLSHRHVDHLGGLPRVVETVGVRTYLDAPFPHPTPAYAHLMRALEARHVPVKDAVRGRRVDLGGGATLTLLGPPEPLLAGTRSDVNANSTLARVDFDAISVLLPGDAEAQTERWALDEGVSLAATVVKVPHHGSRYSSTAPFVRAVHPQVAVVSVAAVNEYHHPAPQTIARWQRAGARVYRTDLDGEVTVESDGKTIHVATRNTHVTEAP